MSACGQLLALCTADVRAARNPHSKGIEAIMDNIEHFALAWSSALSDTLRTRCFGGLRPTRLLIHFRTKDIIVREEQERVCESKLRDVVKYLQVTIATLSDAGEPGSSRSV
jgi:hypothetical protein